jgi:membrane fusion protein (multidrug efflux system)
MTSLRFVPASRRLPTIAALAVSLIFVAACSKQNQGPPPRPPAEVTVLTVEVKDVPITAEYVAQTQSSQAVNIQARVSGFLDKRVYTEGSVVKAGQVLFQMDQKPFQAQVDAQKAALQRNQAALSTAKANLDRTKPLTEAEALSQKDLDDAQGQYDQAAAAVEQSKAQVQEAELNLSYTTIASPVTGVSSYAAIADGTYVNPQNAQLTTVSVLSPMWVNFSVSENEMGRIRDEVKKGLLVLPPGNSFTVEVELVDGTQFPSTGKITFADPSYNSQTGTFLIRASVDNPQGLLRPNQYVRARLRGATRPKAILIPQRAVQQGAKGHFVWVINKQGEAEQRPVVVGDWYAESWFIFQGLNAGDRVVVDGGQRLAPGTVATVKPYVPNERASAGGARLATPAAPPAAAAQSAAAPRGSIVQFASGSATLDAGASQAIEKIAAAIKNGVGPVTVIAFVERSGNVAANADIAKRRAATVRDALIKTGVPAERIRLGAPADASGTGVEAQQVEIITGL